MKCRFCRRSLRGVRKVHPDDKFSELYHRHCPESPVGRSIRARYCERETQIKLSAGSGKKALSIVFDDAAVPSRGARLGTRARWASEYLKRFFSGQKADKESIGLALKWIDEVIGHREDFIEAIKRHEDFVKANRTGALRGSAKMSG